MIPKTEYRSIVDSFKSGKTTGVLSIKYNVSRQRIQQILAMFKINRNDGGVKLQGELAKLEKQKIKKHWRATRITRNYGCTIEQYDLIMKGQVIESKKQSPAKDYFAQKRNSILRGIDFKLSFWEWYNIWKDSGHLNERGKTLNKYVMSRKLNEGPYSADNIEIKKCQDNIKERIPRNKRLYLRRE